MSILDGRVVLAFLAGACYGQQMDNVNVFDSEIRGHISGAQSVELVEAGTQNLAGRSQVNSDGMFVLTGVTPGSYIVRPIAATPRSTARPEEIEVSVGPAKSPSETITGTVSAQALAKPPSKSALKYLSKAQHYSEVGNSAKAIEVLRSAPMDPAGAPYLHSRLGTEYLKSGQFALAVPELEEAARLLPREPIHHSNLAYVYRALGQPERAEKEARLALSLDDSSAKAHFLLGSLLLDRRSTLPEAIANLKLARAEVPSAKFLLAQIYLFTGQREAADREMDAYLSVATEAQKAAARQWLAERTTPKSTGETGNE